MSTSATNWSDIEDQFTQKFFEKQQAQFWLSEEIPITNDALDWQAMTGTQRLAYMRASGGLNAMDTLQGEVGMPTLHRLVEGHQRKATLAWFAVMENIHARSYSMANKALLPASEEREVFAWLERQPHLQYKLRTIRALYEGGTLLEAMAGSCVLETALFYSGFFYPMWLAGQGKMVNMGEVFSLIIKDEAIHGVYVGLLAQEEYAKLSEAGQAGFREWFRTLALDLYANECAYTDEVFGDLGLSGEIKAFVRANFNTTADNLGLERLFPDEEINAVVQNGITNRNPTHDFFSSKGSSYQKITVSPLTDARAKEAWNVERIAG